MTFRSSLVLSLPHGVGLQNGPVLWRHFQVLRIHDYLPAASVPGSDAAAEREVIIQKPSGLCGEDLEVAVAVLGHA